MTWPHDSDGSSDNDERASSSRGLQRDSRSEDPPHDSSDPDESTALSFAPDEARERVQKPALVCTTDSVKVLVTLLTCLFQGKKDERVRCDMDRVGMLFTSHSRGKSLQIKTSLGSELFDTYDFDEAAADDDYAMREANDSDDDNVALDAQVSFALNLSALIECLSMFGPSALATSSLRLSYYPVTANLTLVVEDNGVICECSLQVLELESNDVGQLEFESAFEQSAVVARCIMQSEPFHDAFAELYDLPSAATVTIAMFPDLATSTRNGNRVDGSSSCLRLSATSETGSCEIDFARSSSAFIEFFCAASDEHLSNNACAATFHVAVLQQAFKALAHSNETFLRMNADGFLSVQHMVESGTGDKAFVDALISPEDTSIP